jgi:ligand-binding sensor domain-containing protein
MIDNSKLDMRKLKGKPGKMRDWMESHHIPPGLMVILLGVISTIWFLVRVIPKPSRATYPCMKVAAPFMSGLIVYLLSVAGLTFASRKFKQWSINVRYISTVLLMCGVFVVFAINPSIKFSPSGQKVTWKEGPDDGPNHPIGTAVGVNPGRVIWAWDTSATKRNIKSYHFLPENYNQEVICRMFNESVKSLAGEYNVSESWDAMFRNFNIRKRNLNIGYTKGEKIFIKINQTSGRGILTVAERARGNYTVPVRTGLGTAETTPPIVLAILRQLINECGIDQADIAVGDPQNPTLGHNYDAWAAEFPNVKYADRTFGTYGRTLIHPTKNDLLFYSDKLQTDKLYDIIENADYMINVANLKPHSGTGITLTAKNHFGSQSREGAYHLHYSHLCQLEGKAPTNAGYHKYRVLVDLMGSKYLGQNTLVYVIDGLYSGGSNEGGPPVRYYMAPFSGNWSSSIFMSQDQVALESVCYDFLRTEWNGTYSHDPSNNSLETWPNINGVDDYLHQAADSANWPKGIIYDPDNSGKPISSLGVHEHWSNPVNKQYSQNLGKPYGIELISIPGNIVGKNAPGITSKTSSMENAEDVSKNSANNSTATEIKATASVTEKTVTTDNKGVKIASVINRSIGEGFKEKKYFAGVLDDNNGKYFLTDIGIVTGRLFNILNENPKIPALNLKNFVYELSNDGPQFWIATPQGAIATSLPVNMEFKYVTVYNTSNSNIMSNNVLSIAVGRNQLRWFGTDKGISAFYNNKWLTPSYQKLYPESLFKDYPITTMATTIHGDSLYVATQGAGVKRVFRNNVDAISGASEYARWGPIIMPSDSVYSLCITKDGTQWIGTDKGVARHIGYKTLENWTVFNTGNGLVNNFVQAIASEPYGKNVWFGTKGGVSVFDGTEWTSFTIKDGLISNNILFIMTDKNGIVYLGTDKGIMVYNFGQLTCYQ